MTNNLKKQLLLLLLCLVSCFSFAQRLTTLKGTVVDTKTKEPIAGAVVSFDNTAIAVYTDQKGGFSISNKRNVTKVTIFLMGYNAQKLTISSEQTTTREILLQSTDTQLTEVVVKPQKKKYSKKNNPAVDLIKKVIENKDKNNIKNQEHYQYKEYERFIFAFNEFNPQSGQFKKYKFLTEYADSSIIDKKPILPFSVKEKVTDVFYRKNPQTEKRIIKGFKNEGLDQQIEQEGINAFIQETFQEVNIFDNYITMLLTNFVGPLSDYQAVSFYKWYLSDTVTIDKERYVQLDFAPFNNRDVGFTGNIFVSLDSTYAVKRAVLRVPKSINVNWVTDMVLQQDFAKGKDGVWVPLESRTAMDLSMYDALKVHVDKVVTTQNFVANMPVSPVYELPDPELYEKDYKKRDPDFWNYHRPETHKDDYKVGELIKKMENSFLVKMALNLGNILMTGYIPLNKDAEVNKLEIGTVPTFFSYNRVEGARFRLTAATTRNFHPNLFLYGYTAYGTRDAKLKYMGEATWSFNKVKGNKSDFPINNLTLSYKYDINPLGQRFAHAERDNIFMSFRSGKRDKLTYNKLVILSYHKEFHNGFSFKLQGVTSDEKPAYNIKLEKRDELGNIRTFNKLNSTEASLTLRYTHNEKFFQLRRRRVEIPTERFIVEMTHTVAIKGAIGGSYSFNKSNLTISKDFWLTPYGKISILTKVDKIWSGNPAFINLISPSSNSSYSVQDGTFYLVDPLEFLHDQQVSWEINYHMGGWLFNRIPLLKQLKWREVFGFRGFYGNLSRKHNPEFNHDAYLFPENSYETDEKPYMEYNIGISNIFNFLRIDYVRRISYLDHPGIDKNGFRVSFNLEF